MGLVEIRQQEIGRLEMLAHLVGGKRGELIQARSDALKVSWKQFDSAPGDARRPAELELVAVNYARWRRPRAPAAPRKPGSRRLIP